MELPIRKTNVVLTLNDAVIIVALMGTSPFVTALAMACSLGIVQAAQKRAPVQVIFNFGAQLLATPLYYALLRFMIQPNAIFSTRSVIGYLLTVALLNELSNIEISAAMYLSEADLTIVTEGLASTAPMVAVIALGNGVIATIVLVMTVAAPVLLLTIPIPVLLSIAAYRAQITRRRQLSDIENLFAATRILSHSKSVHTGAVDFLGHLARMFHASLVELTLLPTAPGNPALVTRTVNGVADEVMEAIPVESLPAGPRGDPEPPTTSSSPRTSAWTRRWPATSKATTGPRAWAWPSPARTTPPPSAISSWPTATSSSATSARRTCSCLGTLAKQLGFALQNGRLHEDLALLEGAQDELVHKAFHDPLTGLANRALFVDHIDGAYHRVARAGNLVFLLYIDLDEFKKINDTFGHGAGDELLVQVAGRLNACVRATDTVARLGGDEFAILLEQAASLEVVEIIAERIVASVGEPFRLATGVAEIGASVGIAFTDAFGQSAAPADEVSRRRHVQGQEGREGTPLCRSLTSQEALGRAQRPWFTESQAQAEHPARRVK